MAELAPMLPKLVKILSLNQLAFIIVSLPASLSHSFHHALVTMHASRPCFVSHVASCINLYFCNDLVRISLYL
jgi:hypothetical protein